jgi:putative ABC transport system permease protein
MYAVYFRFPAYLFRFPAGPVAFAVIIAGAVGLAGTYRAVRRAVSVPAAEAMRPEAPASYKKSAFDGLLARLSPVARMVLRDVLRRPLRLLLSAASIALATAIVLSGSVLGDSIVEVLRLQYEVVHREQIAVTLDQPRPWQAVRDFAHLPGVVSAEGERVVPVRLRAGPLSRTCAIIGLPEQLDLHRLLDADKRPLRLNAAGLSLSRPLAISLALRAGDEVEIEVLESERKKLRVPVAAVVDDFVGVTGYMDRVELARLLDEGPRVNTVLLAVERRDIDGVIQRLGDLPVAAAVGRPEIERGLLRDEVADVFSVLALILALFAAVIAVGVVYNNARIALEVRSRDLATLRILGFTRGELAGVLLGEQAIQVLLGLGPGLYLGRAIGSLSLSTIDRDLLRVPLSVAPSSYVAAVCVVMLAAFASALIVRRQSDLLDLVGVLKARD